MDVYRSLANNSGLAACADDGIDGDMAFLAAADAILQRDNDDDESGGKSRLMAELALISRGSAYVLPHEDIESSAGKGSATTLMTAPDTDHSIRDSKPMRMSR